MAGLGSSFSFAQVVPQTNCFAGCDPVRIRALKGHGFSRAASMKLEKGLKLADVSDLDVRAEARTLQNPDHTV
jgi:hypothetical protein